MRKALPNYESTGFFVIRAPSMPFEAMHRLNPGRSVLDDHAELSVDDQAHPRRRLWRALRRSLEDPLVQDALELASTSLYAELKAWCGKDVLARLDGRVERALVRYLVRMATRPTPYGLFAGVAWGTVESSTHLRLAGRHGMTRHTRLDARYVTQVLQELVANRDTWRAFAYKPNSTGRRLGGQFVYSDHKSDRRVLAKYARLTPELNAVLDAAGDGASSDAIMGLLIEAGASMRQAEVYLRSLVEAGVLSPVLELRATAPDLMAQVLAGLPDDPSLSDRKAGLAAVARDIAHADAVGVDRRFPFHAVARHLDRIEVAKPPDPPRLFHVDLKHTGTTLQLGEDDIDVIRQGVETLAAVGMIPTYNELGPFVTAFVERYGEQAVVPLTTVFDPQTGIQLDRFGPAAPAPIVERLDFSPPEASQGRGERDTDEALLHWLSSHPADVVDLLGDTTGFPQRTSEVQLPPSFCTLVTVLANRRANSQARGNQVWVKSLVGASGLQLLGRFGWLDPDLRRWLEHHASREESLDPEAVYAEVCFLPPGRAANVVLREPLRRWEIPYASGASVPVERQLPVTDLHVTVVRRDVHLWSERLGRRVLPRLSSAYDPGRTGSDIFRFLCALQMAPAPRVMHWDWGGLGRAHKLPMVVAGAAILCPRQWTLTPNEGAQLRGAGDTRELITSVDDLRRSRGWPRYVTVGRADETLLVDLDNPVSVEAAFRDARVWGDSVVRESLVDEASLCVSSPEGNLAHELVVPFVRSEKGVVATAPLPVLPTDRRGRSRSACPGSEWLYAKIYGGEVAGDMVLREVITDAVFCDHVRAATDIAFFVRYADPHPHLRVRVRGDPTYLWTELLSSLREALEEHDDLWWRFQIDQYAPELERYGGCQALRSAEELFMYDSRFALRVLNDEQRHGVPGEERWKVVLVGIDRLLDDFGLSLERKLEFCAQRHEQLASHLGARREHFQEVGRRFRQVRADIAEFRAYSDQFPSAVARALADRSIGLRQVACTLRQLERADDLPVPAWRLIGDYVHMHVNRLVPSRRVEHEFLLFGLLERLTRETRGRASQ